MHRTATNAYGTNDSVHTLTQRQATTLEKFSKHFIKRNIYGWVRKHRTKPKQNACVYIYIYFD